VEEWEKLAGLTFELEATACDWKPGGSGMPGFFVLVAGGE
jgi:hypothetical protein